MKVQFLYINNSYSEEYKIVNLNDYFQDNQYLLQNVDITPFK